MELNLKDIAQKLISELNVKEMIYKARAEGVAMLYDRIREQSEQRSEPNPSEGNSGQVIEKNLPKS